MKITFLGAAKVVTGSCYLVESGGKKMLVDCGMFQGSKIVKAFNERDFAFNPAEIDAVFLTHAHVDHSGLLPKLVKGGFKGPIHCTKATRDLCSILLPDSGHIQESDAETMNRKGLRAGKKMVEPLFTVEDAYSTLKYFKVHDFHKEFEALPGVVVCFNVAGHILGSSFIKIKISEGDKQTSLIFTGDVGQPNQPIIEDPEALSGADFIVTESTYGNRVHEIYDKEEELTRIINEAAERGGNIIIPAFAVGRTQVLLYYFQKLVAEKKIPELPIYVDSPMANKATEITLTNPAEYDAEARALYEMHGNRLVAMRNLRFTETAQESRAINEIPGVKIILSASGMADAGRILHHLKHNLWREDSSVIFAGYQAEGSIGRKLVEGAKRLRIMGEDISVRATIYNMKGFSAHADKEQLLQWYAGMQKMPTAFMVTHGEADAAAAMADELQKRFGVAAYVPQFGDCLEIEGKSWRVNAADTVEHTAETVELYNDLGRIERNYLQKKAQIQQAVTLDAAKAKVVQKKLAKLRKFMDELLQDL